MRRLLLLAIPLAILLVVPASAMAAPKVKAKKTQYGKVLFDRDGQVLYMFTKEKTKKPKCYDSCAAAWPPYLADKKPKAKGAVKQRLLGRSKRKSGDRQVTYNGHSLYYYAHEGPGEILCHNVFGFGGDWLVVETNGKPAD